MRRLTYVSIGKVERQTGDDDQYMVHHAALELPTERFSLIYGCKKDVHRTLSRKPIKISVARDM